MGKWSRPEWTPPILGWQYELHWTDMSEHGDVTHRGTTWFPHCNHPLMVDCTMALPNMHRWPHVRWSIYMSLQGNSVRIVTESYTSLAKAIRDFEARVAGIEEVLAAARGNKLRRANSRGSRG